MIWCPGLPLRLFAFEFQFLLATSVMLPRVRYYYIVMHRMYLCIHVASIRIPFCKLGTDKYNDYRISPGHWTRQGKANTLPQPPCKLVANNAKLNAIPATRTSTSTTTRESLFPGSFNISQGVSSYITPLHYTSSQL